MKPGLFASAAGAVALLLGACDKQGSASSSPATTDETAAFTAAADALAAKLNTGGPRPDDPAVKAFEAQAERGLRTLDSGALPLRGYESYDALCGKTAMIVAAYINLGVDKAPAASRTEVMIRNAEKYRDQMFAPTLFSAHCSAAHLPFLEKAAGADMAGKATALQQARMGAYGQVLGLLQMAGDPTLDEPRRRRAIEQLAGDAANFAIILSQAQRQELAAMTDAVRAGLPDRDRPTADRIKASLAAAPCGRFCQM
ncbi:MAG TPA: hypothetical protein VHM92_13035 [Allosphingosinicella sp.]|nr:hypothetical protein [Allosphingosinicella sp.]